MGFTEEATHSAHPRLRQGVVVKKILILGRKGMYRGGSSEVVQPSFLRA